MSEKKTLITGATGFIGAYLLHYLVQKGEKNIRALKRPGSPMDLVEGIKNQVEWVNGDILDLPSLEGAMEGTGRVYHCAAIVSFNHADISKMIKTNQEGTANVVNLALESSIEKLLHVSSIAAIGRKKNEKKVNEKTKWQSDKWNSPYAVSKHLAEMEVWRGIAEGLSAVIVNPANVLGSGFWQGRTSTGQLFYKIWKGMPFYPRGSTGFVDVRDVARFMAELMESDIINERFIISGENLPFRTILNEIADSLNVKKPHIEVTPFIRETAWRAAWVFSKITGKTPFITKQTARASARTFFYENKKSLEAFPFGYTPIRQTIAETAKQFLESKENGFQPAMLPF
ncbi:MAG TPA: NAD-dependent epimerase/dehydratase family protein [Bacteroidetes bacterium]|nr:NAD-dependent epimerase/dehydratase family protein [Bacteroidota bacterium]